MCQTNYADRRSVRLGLTMAAPSQPFLGASSIARFGGITPAFALPPSLPSPPQTRAVVDELEVAEAGAMVDNVVGAGGGGGRGRRPSTAEAAAVPELQLPGWWRRRLGKMRPWVMAAEKREEMLEDSYCKGEE